MSADVRYFGTSTKRQRRIVGTAADKSRSVCPSWNRNRKKERRAETCTWVVRDGRRDGWRSKNAVISAGRRRRTRMGLEPKRALRKRRITHELRETVQGERPRCFRRYSSYRRESRPTAERSITGRGTAITPAVWR